METNELIINLLWQADNCKILNIWSQKVFQVSDIVLDFYL